MTKQNERDILNQIAALIAKCGPDSYIGMAFEGCCELAADNIENDFGDSWRSRWASAEDKRAAAAREVIECRAAISRMEEQLERSRDLAASWQDRANEAARDMAGTMTALNDARAQCSALSDELEAREQEIIRLKAKLYDALMA